MVECDVIVVCLHRCDVILLLSTSGFASESASKLDSLDSQIQIITLVSLSTAQIWIWIWQIEYAISVILLTVVVFLNLLFMLQPPILWAAGVLPVYHTEHPPVCGLCSARHSQDGLLLTSSFGIVPGWARFCRRDPFEIIGTAFSIS